MVWIIISIVLLIICIIEALIIFKDDGIIAGFVSSAKSIADAHGWKAVIEPSISMIKGMIRDVLPSRKCHSDGDVMSIAFSPCGGLGDYIISAKVMEEIQDVCICKVDIFCDKKTFGEAIYGNREAVAVLDYNLFEKRRYHYDLALQVEHFVHVKNCNWEKLKTESSVLYEKIKYITDHWLDLYVPLRTQYWRERIHFEKCKCLGLDRWTELRMGGAFEIKNKHVYIPMITDYEKEWHRLRISEKYITVNYGADAMRRNQKQIKVWPLKHYVELCKLVKEKYPDIKIYQIGGINDEHIVGCDDYFLGESIELVKWIIKGSLCHIDCEGGLVHLATQLDTKCIVMFGPTPEHMYAYESNTNLRSNKCTACMGIHRDWAYSCLRGENSMCISMITPNIVFREVKKIIHFNEE